MKRNVRNTKYDSKQQLQHSNDYLSFFCKKRKNLIVYEKQQNLTKVSSGTSSDCTLLLKAFRYRNQ